MWTTDHLYGRLHSLQVGPLSLCRISRGHIFSTFLRVTHNGQSESGNIRSIASTTRNKHLNPIQTFDHNTFLCLMNLPPKKSFWIKAFLHVVVVYVMLNIFLDSLGPILIINY